VIEFNFSATILHRLMVQGFGQLVVKFWQNFRGDLGDIVQVKWDAGMKNWRSSTNISLCRKRYKIRL